MRTQIHTGLYLHMGKFTPGFDQMQILFLQIHTCKFTIMSHANAKKNLPMSIFISSQYSAFRERIFTFFVPTDYMTVAETVDIVAK